MTTEELLKGILDFFLAPVALVAAIAWFDRWNYRRWKRKYRS